MISLNTIKENFMENMRKVVPCMWRLDMDSKSIFAHFEEKKQNIDLTYHQDGLGVSADIHIMVIQKQVIILPELVELRFEKEETPSVASEATACAAFLLNALMLNKERIVQALEDAGMDDFFAEHSRYDELMDQLSNWKNYKGIEINVFELLSKLERNDEEGEYVSADSGTKIRISDLAKRVVEGKIDIVHHWEVKTRICKSTEEQ